MPRRVTAFRVTRDGAHSLQTKREIDLMTIANAAITVTDEPTLVSGISQGGQAVWLQVDTDGGGGDVWFGGPDIAVGEGPKLTAGLEIGIDLQRASDHLYAICDTGETATLLVLRVAE